MREKRLTTKVKIIKYYDEYFLYDPIIENINFFYEIGPNSKHKKQEK